MLTDMPASGESPNVRRTPAEPAGRRELILDVLRTSRQPHTIVDLAERLGVHANTVRFHLDALLRTGQVEQLMGGTAGPGRPPSLFRATHRMDPAGPTSYRLLATMLTSHLAANNPDPTGTATELGRTWGPQLIGSPPAGSGRRGTGRVEALTRVVNLLAALGFAPEAPTGPRDTTIRLRHCPFLGVVKGPTTGVNDPTTGVGSPTTGVEGPTTGVEGPTTGVSSPTTGAGDYRNVVCSLHLGVMQGALAVLDSPVTTDRLDPFVEPDLCVAHLAPVKAGTSRATGTVPTTARSARRARR